MSNEQDNKNKFNQEFLGMIHELAENYVNGCNRTHASLVDNKMQKHLTVMYKFRHFETNKKPRDCCV